MGGVVKAVKKAVNTVVNTVVDVVKKTVQVLEDVGKFTIDTFKAPIQVTYDVVVKGNSFKKSVARQIQDLGEDLGDIYNNLLDDALGIDDGKFLGLKGGIFEELGMLTKDFYQDQATDTVGIGIIAALVVASLLFPAAYGAAGAVALAAFEAGITSTIALMTVYYATLTVISFGVGAIVSGIIDGAVLAMYPSLLEDMFFFEQGQEALRIATLASIMDGSIWDRLAGGWLYDSQFAGSVYYDATTPANLNISVGGDLSLTPHAISTQFGWIDNLMKNLPGDENFSVLKM